MTTKQPSIPPHVQPSTVYELKEFLKNVPDWMPVKYIEKHEHAPDEDGYDDYGGLPTGKYTPVYFVLQHNQLEVEEGY